METSYSLRVPLGLPILTKWTNLRFQLNYNVRVAVRRVGTITACRRMGNDHDYEGGKLVDENMILLRLRMKEIEIMERGERVAPSNWMEWERKYFVYFHQDVYQVIGFLQEFFMNTRPCLALGIVAFFASSVFFSTTVLMLHSMEMFKGLIQLITFVSTQSN